LVLFADAGALYALLAPRDAHHDHARRVERRIRDQRIRLWTIDPALGELWLILRRDLTRSRCDELVRGLMAHGIDREPTLDTDYQRAWAIGERWGDQDFSLTDRLAFAVMERTQRYRAWSYDQDYRVIRLGVRRDRALELAD
jgi:predicted nucleic acid-binding protein